jgi:hypothetical protein
VSSKLPNTYQMTNGTGTHHRPNSDEQAVL